MKTDKEKFHFKYVNCDRTLMILSLKYSPLLNMYVVNYYDQEHCFNTLQEAQEEMANCVKNLNYL